MRLVLKLYQLAFESQEESLSTLLFMICAEAELVGGIWLVGGFHSAGLTRVSARHSPGSRPPPSPGAWTGGAPAAASGPS